MRATPGACIKPGCLAQRPLCPKVTLPASCKALRRGSASVVPQSKSTELCSSAAVIPQSKSTEM